MIFNKRHRWPSRLSAGGFTLVEAVVAVSLIGVGVASTLGALTKFNAMAATSRNQTGAYQVVMNQIDLFQSMGPFNPQKFLDGVTPATPQIPKYIEPTNNPLNLPSYDMTPGTHTIGYKDPVTGVVSDQWPVYQYTDPNTGRVVIVKGTVTIDVTDLNPGSTTTYLYKAVVTIKYNYLNRDGSSASRPFYTLSMSTIRTSDI